MKRKEKMSSFPCQCLDITFCLQKGAEMPGKSPRLVASFADSTLGSSRAAGLVSQTQLPATPQHDREFTAHQSLASGPPTSLTGINCAQCRQSVGCSSPATTSLLSPVTPSSCPLSPIFGCHSISL